MKSASPRRVVVAERRLAGAPAVARARNASTYCVMCGVAELITAPNLLGRGGTAGPAPIAGLMRVLGAVCFISSVGGSVTLSPRIDTNRASLATLKGVSPSVAVGAIFVMLLLLVGSISLLLVCLRRRRSRPTDRGKTMLRDHAFEQQDEEWADARGERYPARIIDGCAPNRPPSPPLSPPPPAEAAAVEEAAADAPATEATVDDPAMSAAKAAARRLLAELDAMERQAARMKAMLEAGPVSLRDAPIAKLKASGAAAASGQRATDADAATTSETDAAAATASAATASAAPAEATAAEASAVHAPRKDDVAARLRAIQLSDGQAAREAGEGAATAVLPGALGTAHGARPGLPSVPPLPIPPPAVGAASLGAGSSRSGGLQSARQLAEAKEVAATAAASAADAMTRSAAVSDRAAALTARMAQMDEQLDAMMRRAGGAS